MVRTSKRARRTSPLNLPGAFELFTPSKEIFLKNIWIFGPLYAVPFIFWLHSWIWSPLPNQHVQWWQHSRSLSAGWPGSPLPTNLTFLVVGFSGLWFFIIAVMGTIIQVMTLAAQLDAVQHKHLDFQVLWQAAKKFSLRIAGLYLLMSVIFFVGGLILAIGAFVANWLGLVLLAIPILSIGLFLISRYFLTPYVLIDQDLGLADSLKTSAEMTRSNPGAIWGLLGALLLISLINIVPYLGSLVAFAVGSLYSLAPALRYQQLKQIKNLA